MDGRPLMVGVTNGGGAAWGGGGDGGGGGGHLGRAVIMVREPGELYEVTPDAPELDGAALLYYLDGFIDAGAAGKLLTAHLLGTLEHQEVARFHVDRLIDYRSRRPPMTFERDHWEHYDAP